MQCKLLWIKVSAKFHERMLKKKKNGVEAIFNQKLLVNMTNNYKEM